MAVFVARLPCGVAVDDLLEQIADEAHPSDPGHQGHCPHCQAMLAELRGLWAPVGRLAATAVEAPVNLVHDVMRRVRDLARQGWQGVLQQERGVTRIAAVVVARIAAVAAQRLPGVSLALGRLHATPLGAVEVGLAGTRAAIDVDIIAPYDRPLHRVADAVREAVIHDVATLADLEIIAVNVTIVDVRIP